MRTRFDDEDWRVTKSQSTPTREIDLGAVEFWKDERILSEVHHNNYGRPWIMGRYQFDFLLERGLAPGHRVLDFGCGSGRLALHLVRFLEPGGYCGLDSNPKSAQAFAYEMHLHGLLNKKPRFLLDSSLALDAFGQRFDFIVDFYTLKHLDEETQTTAFAAFARVLAPGGRVLIVPPPRLASERLQDLGFRQTVSLTQPCPALEQSRFTASNAWTEYQLES